MSNQSAQPQSSGATAAKQVTQGDAVVQAVRDVLKGEYKEGVKVVLNDDQRKAVTELLVRGFTERRIPLKTSPANEEKLADAKKLHAYVKGLINNWLVKSPALNGKPKKAKPATVTEAKAEVKAVEQPKSDKEADATPMASKKPTPPAAKK